MSLYPVTTFEKLFDKYYKTILGESSSEIIELELKYELDRFASRNELNRKQNYRSILKILEAFPLKAFDSFSTFDYLVNVDCHYINISMNKSFLMNYMIAYQVSLNLNVDILKQFYQEKLSMIPPQNVFVAGGFFSKYISNNDYSKKYSEYYKICSKNADIDFYIQESSISNSWFNKLHDKFRSQIIEYRIDTNSNSNEMRGFKIKFDEKIMNIMFIDKYETILSILNEFDFSLCKIFYSFKLDSIFAHGSLFKQHTNLSEALGEINQDLQLDYYLIKFKNLYEKFWVIDNSDFNSFRLVYTQESYEQILKFLKKDFNRVCKYLFKGFFQKTTDNHELVKLIDIFSEKFKCVIQDLDKKSDEILLTAIENCF